MYKCDVENMEVILTTMRYIHKYALRMCQMEPTEKEDSDKVPPKCIDPRKIEGDATCSPFKALYCLSELHVEMSNVFATTKDRMCM